jgi:hypothetical protein
MYRVENLCERMAHGAILFAPLAARGSDSHRPQGDLFALLLSFKQMPIEIIGTRRKRHSRLNSFFAIYIDFRVKRDIINTSSQ